VTGKPLEQSLHRPTPPELTEPDLTGVVLDGRYRVLRLLGRGGSGRVYEAENLLLRKLVAVKFVAGPGSNESLTRLRREAQIIASIQHPNICDLYDIGTTSDVGRPYLVLERLFGDTLASHLKRAPRLAPERALDLFAQILSGLNAAHASQILHRDLKPQNVFIVHRLGCAPIAKLVDFGLAKDLTGVHGTTLTQPGKVCGTLQYMSPEQLCGAKLDVRSDLFAVGVMLYEALSGVHPFAARTMPLVQESILRATPDPLRGQVPGVSVALERVVLCALAKAPRERFQSAVEMQRALVTALGPRPRASWSDRQSSDEEATTAERNLSLVWATYTPAPG
jgi:serine/threonine-protein kinase